MNSQHKGARGERELVDVLRDLGFIYTRRQSAMYRTGAEAPDVGGIAGIHIEAKRVARLNVTEALQQAIADTRAPDRPLLCHRRNNGPWLATVRLDDLPEVARRILAAIQSTPFDDPAPKTETENQTGETTP